MVALIVIDVILGAIAFLGQSVIAIPFKAIAGVLDFVPYVDLGKKFLAVTIESKFFSAIFTFIKLPFYVVTAIIVIMFILKLLKKFIAKRREKKQLKEQREIAYAAGAAGAASVTGTATSMDVFK